MIVIAVIMALSLSSAAFATKEYGQTAELHIPIIIDGVSS